MQIQTCENGNNDVAGREQKNVLMCHKINLKDNKKSFAIGITAAELTDFKSVKTYFKY